MKKKSLVIFAILLILTCIASVFYLKSRNNSPKGNLAVVNGDKTVYTDPFSGSLVPVKGVIISGKGQEKDIDETGILLKDVIKESGLSDTVFTKVRIVSSDEYAAEISFDEINDEDNVYLAKQQEDDGSTSARLYVFGDNDSKRQVKNVERIELLNE